MSDADTPKSQGTTPRAGWLTRRFRVAERGSTPGREVIGGATTFLAMAYIIFVNPAILAEAGMDAGAVATVTILASAIGTILAGLLANVPFAMAPGMGLNSFFTYSLVLGMGLDWRTALGVVFFSGIVFLILTLAGFREKVVQAIPLSLRLAIPAGIGLFIAFIGFVNLGLIAPHPATLVTLGDLSPSAGLGLLGLAAAAALDRFRIPGGLLMAILAVAVVGWLTGLAPPPSALLSHPPSPGPVAFRLDLAGALQVALIAPIFSFMFVDLFDSVGSILACASEAGMADRDGRIPAMNRILAADAVATVVGAALGTSTTTTYIESGAGIAAGARTGLANLVTAGLFLLALVFTPVIGAVPGFATAPALILVGVLMFRSVHCIDLSELTTAVPAFLTIVLMPLTYSISTGLCFGFVAYVVMAVVSGRAREVRPLMWGIAVLSLMNLGLKWGG